MGKDHTISLYVTLWGNPNFVPGLEDSQFSRWREKGISMIKDEFDPGGGMYTFEHLKTTYGLLNRDFYMYLQIRHFVQSKSSVLVTECMKNTILDTLSLIKSRPYKVKFLYSPLLEPLPQKAWNNTLKGWKTDNYYNYF